MGAALVAILGALSALHVAWAFGLGSLDGVVPTTAEGGRVLDPGPIASLVVGAGLALAAGLVAVKMGWIGPGLPTWVGRVGVAGLASVFALRAIGDFRWVGFFKRQRSTLFARRDTAFYSPLCLGLAVLAGLLALS